MADTSKDFQQQNTTALLKQGRMEVFGMLYDNYAPALFGFITRIAGEKAAENILQQTFFEVWKNRKALQPANENIFVRMFKIARRLAVEAVRGDHSAENRNVLWLVYSTEVENFLAGRNKTDIIEEPARSALEMIYFKFYTLEKAATKLNLSTQALEMKLKLAIEKLNGVEA